MTTSEYAVGTLGAVTISVSAFLAIQKFWPKLEVILVDLMELLLGAPWFG